MRYLRNKIILVPYIRNNQKLSTTELYLTLYDLRWYIWFNQEGDFFSELVMRSIFFFSHLPYLYFSAFFRQKHANFPQIIDSSLQKIKEHKMCIVATSFGKSLKLNNREHSGWFCMKLSKKNLWLLLTKKPW